MTRVQRSFLALVILTNTILYGGVAKAQDSRLKEIERSMSEVTQNLKAMRGYLKKYDAISALWLEATKNFTAYAQSTARDKNNCVAKLARYKKLETENPAVAADPNLKKGVGRCQREMSQYDQRLQQYKDGFEQIEHDIKVLRERAEQTGTSINEESAALTGYQEEERLAKTMKNVAKDIGTVDTQDSNAEYEPIAN